MLAVCYGDIVFLVEQKEGNKNYILLHSFKNKELISSPLIFDNVRLELLQADRDTAIIHACAFECETKHIIITYSPENNRAELWQY